MYNINFKLLILLITGVSCSSVFAGEGPEVISLPAAMGNVTFLHHKHQKTFVDCSVCHLLGPGKINELGKEFAHKICKGCHYKKKEGPTACKDCHIR